MKVNGERVVLAAETKIVVVSFQDTPPGISPYLILAANPQTINENNTFASDVMAICVEACKNAGNAVVLNDSTDGVSCEVQSNFEQQKKFLRGDSSQLSLVDPNHNLKNFRFQATGGSGTVPAVFGNHVFDVMLLKMSGISKELVRVEDYASDALVLKLASDKVVRKLLDIDTADNGNKMVSKVSLTMSFEIISSVP
jgi:hypothetical protein